MDFGLEGVVRRATLDKAFGSAGAQEEGAVDGHKGVGIDVVGLEAQGRAEGRIGDESVGHEHVGVGTEIVAVDEHREREQRPRLGGQVAGNLYLVVAAAGNVGVRLGVELQDARLGHIVRLELAPGQYVERALPVAHVLQCGAGIGGGIEAVGACRGVGFGSSVVVDAYALDGRAARKGLAANSGRAAQDDVPQSRAARKGLAANLGHVLGNGDVRQCLAALEHRRVQVAQLLPQRHTDGVGQHLLQSAGVGVGEAVGQLAVNAEHRGHAQARGGHEGQWARRIAALERHLLDGCAVVEELLLFGVATSHAGDHWSEGDLCQRRAGLEGPLLVAVPGQIAADVGVGQLFAVVEHLVIEEGAVLKAEVQLAGAILDGHALEVAHVGKGIVLNPLYAGGNDDLLDYRGVSEGLLAYACHGVGGSARGDSGRDAQGVGLGAGPSERGRAIAGEGVVQTAHADVGKARQSRQRQDCKE